MGEETPQVFNVGQSMINSAIDQYFGQSNANYSQNLSVAGQKELADYQHNLNLDWFEKTGIKGQMRQAKEAGANIQTLFAKGAGPTGTGGSIPSISNQKISDTNTSSNMQAISAAQINNVHRPC